jgi:SpoVK/Ycf46/Vps4 family AAA+-type ATPase
LEYYEGILFLTTNRIGTFDRAFKSRIHLAIHYPKLSEESRKSLWHSFLIRASPESAADLIYRGDLDIFAREDLNGRQIRNVVRTAHALAVSEGIMVAVEHVQMALGAMKTFEADFEIGSAEAQRELHDTGGSDFGSFSAKRRRIG